MTKDFDIDTALAYCVSREIANHDVTGANLTEQELDEVKRRALKTAREIKQDYLDGKINIT